MLEAHDRVVMVSGASRGIGRAVVERLLQSGFIVSAGLRDVRSLPASERLLVHRYDAASTESAATWVAATVARFGQLHGLVNCAGINPHVHLLEEDETDLDAMWLVNVKGPLRLIRFAMPHLKACGTGRVVNLSSLSGKRVPNARVGYPMSKFAVMALTHAVRHEGWAHGVRATAMCPGFVATDMTQGVTAMPGSEMIDRSDLAVLIETVLLLPNTSSVAELLVNCRLEPLL